MTATKFNEAGTASSSTKEVAREVAIKNSVHSMNVSKRAPPGMVPGQHVGPPGKWDQPENVLQGGISWNSGGQFGGKGEGGKGGGKGGQAGKPVNRQMVNMSGKFVPHPPLAPV